ncbi:hypothetical protein VM1G_02562 [Cytospora mali]|uniref:Uncharacterized protein n=1 Tax=Cytospora mali TaxID=578113 RepID=A0A194VUW9_CYTMA|nr:hypothetical protein VM1G_02562 [Valsa mali]
MSTVPKSAFVAAWLSTLPCDSRSHSRKRKRQRETSPSSTVNSAITIIPSPPITNPDVTPETIAANANSDMTPAAPATPAKKRPRDNDKGGLDFDLNATPRGDMAGPPASPSFPHHYRPRYAPPRSESSLPSLSAETTSSQYSSRPGSASPRKRMRRLAIADDGIETRSFAAARLLSQGPSAHGSYTLPPDLHELLCRMNKVKFAEGVVPLALKDEILAAADRMSMYVPPSAFLTQNQGARDGPSTTVADHGRLAPPYNPR